MSARRMDVLEVVSRYVAGYFPLYDPWDRFYWERLAVRAKVNPALAGQPAELAIGQDDPIL